MGSSLAAIAQAGLRISPVRETGDAQQKYGLPGYPLELVVRATKS